MIRRYCGVFSFKASRICRTWISPKCASVANSASTVMDVASPEAINSSSAASTSPRFRLSAFAHFSRATPDMLSSFATSSSLLFILNLFVYAPLELQPLDESSQIHDTQPDAPQTQYTTHHSAHSPP